MTETVGYRLLDATGEIVRSWGGIWGQCPGMPNPLILPNGDIIAGAELDQHYSGYTLVAWVMEPPAHNLLPLPRWRFKAMLRLTGHEADIIAWLSTLVDPESPNYDPATWAVASAILEDSDEYRLDHPLTETLRQVAGVTVEQLEALWDHAHGL